jgi:hypothetical protein
VSISRDTETVGPNFTSTGAATAISHPGSASARAACVLIDQNASATDQVSGVTYGGVAMSRIRSESEATEAGRTYIYWLDNIPTGTQDVVVTTTSTSSKQAVVATMLVASGKIVTVAGSATGTSASVANPSWTISGLTASSVLMAYEVIHSGLQTMTTTPAASWTLISSTDLGSQGRGFARQAVASSGTTLTCGWTASTADDFVGDSVAFIESDPPNVTNDASASSSSAGSGSLTFSHTCAATATKLYVAAIIGVSGDTGEVVTATYNGVSMTDCGAGAKHANNGTNGFLQIFELDNPASGAHNVVITVTTGNTPNSIIGIASSYIPGSGLALQSGTPVTAAAASGTSPITVNVTGTTNGNLVFGAACVGSPALTPLLTSRGVVNVNSNTAAGNGAAEDGAANGGTVAVGFTVGSADDSAVIALEIKAVSSGDTGTGSVRMKKPSLSGVATAPLLGTGSIRMKKMGLSGVATAPLIGTGSVSMHKMSLAAAGKSFNAGTGSARMHKMGILASGSVGVTDIGSGSIAMHKMSLSATGKEVDAGTGSVSMHKMGLAATGHAPLVGTGSVSMHKPSLSATGKEVDAGTGSVRMKKMGVSGSGTFHIPGTGSIRMRKMGVAATGIVGTFIVGTGSARMKKMGLSGSGQEFLLGSGSVSMHKMSISGLAAIILQGSGSVRMRKMSLSGSAKIVILGTGSVSMHKMVPHGTMADLGSGDITMHKMSVHGIAVSTRRASNLFIFTAV